VRVSITVPVAESEGHQATPYQQIRDVALAADAAGLTPGGKVWVRDGRSGQREDCQAGQDFH
jgi:hypothetical protein